MSKTKKIRVRINIDEEKWKEINRRLPGTDISLVIDQLFQDLIDGLIVEETNVGPFFSLAALDAVQALRDKRKDT